MKRRIVTVMGAIAAIGTVIAVVNADSINRYPDVPYVTTSCRHQRIPVLRSSAA